MPRPFYYRVGHGIARREGTKAVIASAPTRDNTVHVAIIVGSTRPGRQADSVARWVHGLAAGRDRASFEVVDIADFELPLLDEDLPPMAAQYARPHTHRWAATIARFDAFVLVTPEYNHSPAAALKNALDFLYAEWNDKAVAFVSYGIDGGIRAVEHLRQIAGELQLADIRAAVSLSFAADFEGYTQFTPAEGRDSAVAGMLDDLLRWGRALKSMRTAAARA